MKKFLIVLMVVAMASFLLVGCMPDGVTPPVDEDEDEDEGLPVSTTPVIEEIEGTDGIDLYSSDIQYINEDKAKNGILVKGFAPKYSKVQVYIDGIVVGTSTAYGGDEMFKVFISKTSLGVDGEKTIYATATEIGLKESDPSTEYKFTLDTVAPTIETISIDDKEVSDIVLVAHPYDAAKEVTIEMSEPVKSGSAEAEIYCISGPTFVAVDANLYGAFTISKDKLTLTVTPKLPGTWIEGIWTYGFQEDVLEDLAGNPFDGSKTFTILLYGAPTD